MLFRIGTIMLIGAGLLALGAPASADDTASTGKGSSVAPVSAASAILVMTADDSASHPATSVAQARREFLAALANERTDAAVLARLLPRAGQPVAAVIGAAPAGQARAEAVLRRLGLDPERFLGARTNLAQGGPFIAASDPEVRSLQADSVRQAAMAATFARCNLQFCRNHQLASPTSYKATSIPTWVHILLRIP